MRTRPDISDDRIIACLYDRFGLRTSQAVFLPVGADYNRFAFRVTVDDGTSRFLKLSRRSLDEAAITVPAFLHARGIRRVMAPIATITHQAWATARGFSWVLYPFFEGRNGFEARLSAGQWVALGETLKAVHSTVLPTELAERVAREDFSPRYRQTVMALHQQMQRSVYDDPIAARFAAFWNSRRDGIGCIVERAERLARALRDRPIDLAVCHGDFHGGNVLVGADDELAIVDWDELILAPKERDLMFVGGGVGGVWNQAEEPTWFYEGYDGGYDHAQVDPIALTYYRYERIVADLAEYARQILGVQGSVADREEGLGQLEAQFLPGYVVDIAHRSYANLG